MEKVGYHRVQHHVRIPNMLIVLLYSSQSERVLVFLSAMLQRDPKVWKDRYSSLFGQTTAELEGM